MPLQKESRITAVHAADAQRWSGGPLKLMVLPAMSRSGLSARRSDLVCEDCVKHRGADTRPRPQAGALCVREETRKDRNTKFCSAPRGVGSGEVTTS